MATGNKVRTKEHIPTGRIPLGVSISFTLTAMKPISLNHRPNESKSILSMPLLRRMIANIVCGPARPALVIREKNIIKAYTQHHPSRQFQFNMRAGTGCGFLRVRGQFNPVKARLWLQLINEAVGFFSCLCFQVLKGQCCRIDKTPSGSGHFHVAA